MNIMPSVIETVGRSKKGWDIPTKLYNDSDIITMFGGVDDDLAYTIITQLLYLDTLDRKDNIKLYINSPGGSIYSGLAIKDTIDTMNRKVDTIGMGMCASMGAYLLFCGTGERKALNNCRIMIHSASSGSNQSTVHDLKIDLAETVYVQDKMMQHISEFSKGKMTKEQVEDATYRDNYLSPEETVELGLIDSIV